MCNHILISSITGTHALPFSFKLRRFYKPFRKGLQTPWNRHRKLRFCCGSTKGVEILPVSSVARVWSRCVLSYLARHTAGQGSAVELPTLGTTAGSAGPPWGSSSGQIQPLASGAISPMCLLPRGSPLRTPGISALQRI